MNEINRRGDKATSRNYATGPIETEPNPMLSQSVIEDIRTVEDDDQYSKQSSIKKQEEYLKYLQNKQKIKEMESQLNKTYSHSQL